MLTLELNGQRYSKTEHANALMQKLDGRSRPSIEFKHCNTSAVMIELGYPYIDGYKPRGNYQALLADVVEAQLAGNHAVQDAAQAAVLRPAVEVALLDPLAVWVPAPHAPPRQRESPPAYGHKFVATRRDYLAQEAHNRSLGRAGELFVLELEARLLEAVLEQTLGADGEGADHGITIEWKGGEIACVAEGVVGVVATVQQQGVRQFGACGKQADRYPVVS